MDVSLSGRRVFCFLLAIFSVNLISCGNRYDLSTAAGQQSRIDDANNYLSAGDCSDASNAISPLYNSQYVTDQVRIIYASTQACFAHFNVLTFANNLAGSANLYNELALSMSNSNGDYARQWMYNAEDVLTENGVLSTASQRTTADNDYMVFLQFGIISTILRNYGSPDGSGNKTGTLSYPGTLTDVDACALTAAFAIISDSYSGSDLSDGTSKATVSSLNAICVKAGLSSCSVINKDRTQCTSTNANGIAAGDVVTSVNTTW